MKEHLVISTFNQTYGKDHPNSGLVVHIAQGSNLLVKILECF